MDSKLGKRATRARVQTEMTPLGRIPDRAEGQPYTVAAQSGASAIGDTHPVRRTSKRKPASRRPDESRARKVAPEVERERRASEDEMFNMFQNTFFNMALPNLPDIPGWHVCWLTTNNPRDSIAARKRIGYTPVTAEDVVGYEVVSIKTGEYAGCIGVNEMVAFKIPLNLYRRYMRQAHYDAPLGEEEKLKSQAEHIQNQAQDEYGANVHIGTGTAELGTGVPRRKLNEWLDSLH